MDIWTTLLLLLVTARLFSEIARRLDLPSLTGEIVAGILLGMLFSQVSGHYPELATLQQDKVFHAVTEFGMFFLMLYAGVELQFRSLRQASGSAIWVAVGGMVVPLLLGMGLGWFTLPESDLKSAQVFFLGVALAITAVPVAIKVLIDLGKLQSYAGQTIVSAAVIDDVISLMLLALLTSFLNTGTFPSAQGLGLLVGKILLFFAITFSFGIYLLPILARKVIRDVNIAESEVSFLLIVALAFSALAEALGMHFIIGAFMAGLFFAKREMKDSVHKDVENKIHAISSGFFAPIFFASIGMSLELSAFIDAPVFVILLLLVASVGKILGAGIPARLTGFSTRDALLIGNAMNARGAVELVVAGMALRAGLFDQPEGSVLVSSLFSAVVIMAILTTLLTPFVLKRIATSRDG